MPDAVQRMLEQLDPAKRAPLEKWNPALSGRIDIRIDRDGRWFHEGSEIRRFELVKLFASILRFEADLGFVLVTPVEKWQLEVEEVPFIAVTVACRAGPCGDRLVFVTNVGEEVCADREHPIEHIGEPEQRRPCIRIRDGLLARLSRPVYYELAERAVDHDGTLGVWSAGVFFPL